MILISVFDKKAAIYWPPQAFEGVAQAMRAYAIAFLKQGDSNLVTFPEDYDLYEVGVFEQEGGIIVPTNPPAYLESLINIKASLQNSGAQKGKAEK